MAITQPSSLAIVPANELTLTKMGRGPLATALANINYLWKYHQPPLLDVCPTSGDYVAHADDGMYEFVVPVLSPIDGMPYQLEFRLTPHGGCSSVILQVHTTTSTNWTTATWTSWRTSTQSCTSGTLKTWIPTAQTMGATMTAMRFRITPNTGSVEPQHILLYPKPGDASYLDIDGSFFPWDDALSAADAPVHTEYFNRCKKSAVAVLQARQQCAFSFAQLTSYRTTQPVSPPYGPKVQSLAPVRCVLPFAAESSVLNFRAFTYNASHTTASLVRVQQVGTPKGNAVEFTADGNTDINSIVVYPKNPGTAGAYVDLQLQARSLDVETKLAAVVAWWSPLV